jgi:hypothetical protein
MTEHVYSAVWGFKIDGNVTQFWAKRSQAVQAAKDRGFPVKNVVKCHTRFQIGYTIMLAPLPGLITRAQWENPR